VLEVAERPELALATAAISPRRNEFRVRMLTPRFIAVLLVRGSPYIPSARANSEPSKGSEPS
jgi:hypothetical protein